MRCILLFVFFLVFIGDATAQVSGSGERLAYQIQKDIEAIDDMLDDMEGYKNKEKLDSLINEYKAYQEESYDSSSDMKELHMRYVNLGNALVELAPDYNSILHNQLINLKDDYENVESKEAYNLLHKRFGKLKREYQKGEPNIIKILKTFKQGGKEEEISLGDAFREIGGILIEMDEYVERFSKSNNLNSKEEKAAKLDPAGFISQITYESGDKHEELKKAEEYLKRGMNSLKNEHNILTNRKQKEYDDLAADYKALKTQKETLNYQFDIERQHFNQEKEQLKAKLTEYERLIDLKTTEYGTVSTQVRGLKNEMKVFEDSLSFVQDDLENTNESKQGLEFKIDSLRTLKEALDKEKETLTADKESAKNGRTLFLITSIALLLTLLGFSLYDRWQLRKEKEILDKNLKYKEGFYQQYMRTSKADIAVQREKLTEQRNQLKDYLRELNHRTRNNLQIISSILGIQIANIENGDPKDVLSDMKKRIQAIGLLHREVYTEIYKTETPVKMQKYVDNLLVYLKQSFEYGLEVVVEKEVENITILPDKALPIGLIINEVVTNSFKYAFPGNPNPKLKITLKYRDKERLYLSIKDNGKQKVDLNDECLRKDTMGIRLVGLLAAELEGQYKYNKNDEGFKFALFFPIHPKY